MRVNIGCGNNYVDGWVNLDISPEVGADVVCDITGGLPFADDSVLEVLAENVLTQLPNPAAFRDVLNELWRVVKPGGELRVRVPLATHEAAFQDPFDIMRFTRESFTYLDGYHRRYEQYGRHYGFKPWYTRVSEDNGIQIRVNLTPIK